MDTPSLPPENWLTVKEAAEELGITPGRVRQLIRAGVIIAVQPHPQLYLIHPDSLDAARARETRRGRKRKN